MSKNILFAVTIMCIAFSCTKVIRVQEPVVVKIVEKVPLIVTEKEVVFPPTPIEIVPEKEEEKAVINPNIPVTITLLVHLEERRLKRHGVISPNGFGDFSLSSYERRNGYTSIYIYSVKWDVKYRVELPHMNGEFALVGHLVNK